MKTITLSGHSVAAISEKLKEAVTTDFQPTLAISFGSVKCDLTEYIKIFNHHNIQLFGASSAGEFINEDRMEEGLVVMLMDIDSDAFAVHHQEADFPTSFSAGHKLATFGLSKFKNPVFLITFSMTVNGEGVIAGVHDLIPREKIFGGMAGDDFAMQATYSFTHEKISASSLTGLVLDGDKIHVDGVAFCGWEPIGGKNRITKSKDNIVYEINGEPAMEVVNRIFGQFYETLDNHSVLMGAAQYPIQMIRDGKYVLRAALYANEADGSLFFGGPVEEGLEFRFSVAPGFEVVDKTVKKFKAYAVDKPNPDALILFSCKARHMSLGPLVEDELMGIHEIWKKNMIGFFTYGEVGMDEAGKTNFYNETCSLVMISEK